MAWSEAARRAAAEARKRASRGMRGKRVSYGGQNAVVIASTKKRALIKIDAYQGKGSLQQRKVLLQHLRDRKISIR